MSVFKEFVMKKFLSDAPHETGSISVWATVCKYEHELILNGKYDISAEVVIKDCHKTISLDFYAEDEKSQKGRLEKLDVLISTLNEFRKVLPEVYEEYNTLSKRVDTEEQQG